MEKISHVDLCNQEMIKSCSVLIKANEYPSMLLQNSDDPFISSVNHDFPQNQRFETDNLEEMTELTPKKDKTMKKFFFHNFKFNKDHQPLKKESVQQRKFMFQKSKILKSKGVDSTKEVPAVKRSFELPYMSTISLDHNKPRRGRKPKQSDIINLIKKNYGITLSQNSPQDEPLNLCIRSPKELETVPGNPGKKMVPVPQKKKKRSPIFIPNGFNTNEVSLGKFKLAANGSLLEKKYVSVSANGNFNYGSTNDKLKRQTKEDSKMAKTTIKKAFQANHNSAAIEKNITAPPSQCGFLIQTQEQLTNQGGGYYKFRHLKNITRYILKNWKNYLPAQQ